VPYVLINLQDNKYSISTNYQKKFFHLKFNKRVIMRLLLFGQMVIEVVFILMKDFSANKFLKINEMNCILNRQILIHIYQYLFNYNYDDKNSITNISRITKIDLGTTTYLINNTVLSLSISTFLLSPF
jgi:hypothetical protein